MSVKTAFKTQFRKLLADTVTPVSLYLKLRDHFAYPMLLESSDYHGDENNLSIIGLEPFASFEVKDGREIRSYPDGSQIQNDLPPAGKIKMASSELRRIPESLQQFLAEFPLDHSELPFDSFGAFGYQAYDMVRYYEKVEIEKKEVRAHQIPDMQYFLFRYLLVINHRHNELYLIEYQVDEKSKLGQIETLINSQALPIYEFELVGEETANMEDQDFLDMVAKGKYHCQRGDVFQMVLSRQYAHSFMGDEFNVYRALRSVNPSPYLFYCDFGNFKLFGSSPEAQLIIEDGKATIHPIAGTFKRTGNDEEDLVAARKLFDDPKENSEHVMLVDLARNDLSRHGNQVEVDTYKEIQYYSHVIHLVSKVVAEIEPDTNHLQLMADTFPAGTLSGAPKVRAMQLIEEYEPQSRGFYGGCIGWLNGNGKFNHAIMIRSFLSKGNRLFFQAGAGIVSRSVPENELQEVHNKLGALRMAIQMASSHSSKTSTQA
ncbi:MAG: anthranilate synthase component I family protein [Bacteroidia bacterium]|nr:anthranilate synthase component I family protein [Bacteroidia bacterium]